MSGDEQIVAANRLPRLFEASTEQAIGDIGGRLELDRWSEARSTRIGLAEAVVEDRR